VVPLVGVGVGLVVVVVLVLLRTRVALVVALGGGGAAPASGLCCCCWWWWWWWCWGVVDLGGGGCGCWVCGLAGRGLEGQMGLVGAEVLGCWHRRDIAIVRGEAVGGRGAGMVRVFPALGHEWMWPGARGGSLPLVVSVV